MNIINNEYWPLPPEKLREIPHGEKFVCMFSGGKDCGLALSLALENGILCELLHCAPKDASCSLWHQQSLSVAQEQARLIGTPLRIIPYSAWFNYTKLVRLYHYYLKQGITSVVFGDLYDEKQAKLQTALCLSAGLIPRMPLWQRSYNELLELKKQHSLSCIITCLESDKLETYWLGKVFNYDAYQYFTELGIDAMGEQGEFHTTLVNARYFHHPLRYQLGEIVTTPTARSIALTIEE